MRRLSRACRAMALGGVVLALVLVSLVAVSGPSQASGVGEKIERYAATYTLAKDGSVRVELDFDYALGSNGGHGPLVRVPVQVATADKTQDRLYPISGITASSPTGAPAQVRTKMRHGVLSIFVGDPDREMYGTQTYRVSYTQKGVINHFGDRDEFYWNVLAAPDMWVSDATALVHAPAAAQTVACYSGDGGSRTPCAKATDTLREDIDRGTALPDMKNLEAVKGDAAFWDSLVPTGTYLTIDAAYPQGTFAGSPVFHADPSARTKYVFEWDPLTKSIAIGGGLLLLGLLALVGRYLVRRVGVGPLSRARDRLTEAPVGAPQLYASVGAAGASPMMGSVVSDSVVGDEPGYGSAPRVLPPDGVRPNEVALLANGRPGRNDLSALLLDLARRGIIAIEPFSAPGLPTGDGISAQVARAVAEALGAQDWRLTLLAEPDASVATEAERAVLGGLFAHTGTVSLRTLDARTLGRVNSAMNRGAVRDVAAEGWFRPGFRASQRIGPLLALLIPVYVLSMVGLGSNGMGMGSGPWLILLGGLFAFLILMAIALRAPAARTRRGAELFGRLQEFKGYVMDACAGRRTVRASDADVAPWAIAFGLSAPFAAVAEPIADTSGTSTYPWWLFTAHGASGVRNVVASSSSSSGDSSDSGASGSSGSSGSGSAGGGGGGTSVGGW